MRSLQLPLTILALFFVLSGCAETSQSDGAVPAASVSAPAATTGMPTTSPSAVTPTPPTPQSPAHLTAACPFLTAQELDQQLGVGELTASEDAPQHSSGGIQLGCSYQVHGTNPYALSISGFPASLLSVADLVNAVPNDAHNVRKLSGLGQAAIYYTTSDGFGVLCAGKLSHGQVRTASFVAPKDLPQTTFAAVVRLVVARL